MLQGVTGVLRAHMGERKRERARARARASERYTAEALTRLMQPFLVHDFAIFPDLCSGACVCVCVCVQVYKRTHTHTDVNVRARACTDIHTYTYESICVHTTDVRAHTHGSVGESEWQCG